MNDSVLVIDDFFDKEKQKSLQRIMEIDPDIIWVYVLKTVAYNHSTTINQLRVLDKNIYHPGFGVLVHQVLEREKILSAEYYNDFFADLPSRIESKTDISVNKLLRVRFNMSFPMRQSVVGYDLPHSDSTEKNVMTFLYYVNDSDGPTTLFDQHDSVDESCLFDELTIHKKIDPKQGRAIIFDSNRLHAGAWPSQNKRFVINATFLAD
jgi:hypothetical protein